jgi:hypothetical protein
MKTVVFFSMVAIVVLFFMPWVHADVDMIKPIGDTVQKMDQMAGGDGKVSGMLGAITSKAKTIMGKESTTVTLSGYKIASSGQTRTAQMMSSVLSLAGQGAKDPRKVVYVYGIPVAAVVMAFIILTMSKSWPAGSKLVSLLSILIACFATYKLITVATDTSFASATFMYGLWGTVIAYGVMGVSGLMTSSK